MKDENVYLKSIFDNIGKVLSYVESDLPSGALYDAVMYNMTCIGEGASKISKNTREQYPEIPWKKIIGFRNIIVHDYLGVDENDVWTIVEKHLPELRKNIKIIIKDVENG